MSIEGEMTHHLIAELFAATAKILRESDPAKRPDILRKHDELQLGILHLQEFMLGYGRDRTQLSKNS